MKRLAALVALALAAPLVAAAAQGSAADAPAALDLAPSLLQTALGLALVLALIFGATWLLRRLQPSARSGGPLKVVASLGVGQRERVVLLELGDQWLLVGVAPGAVRALHALPKGELPAPTAAPSFARLLSLARAGRDK